MLNTGEWKGCDPKKDGALSRADIVRNERWNYPSATVSVSLRKKSSAAASSGVS